MEELEAYVACSYRVLGREWSGGFVGRDCGRSDVSIRLPCDLGIDR